MQAIAYWLAAGSFAVGCAFVALMYYSFEGEETRELVAYLGIIPGFAGLAYVGMALGIGTVTVNGTEFVGLRYVDWLVTTPVLVGFVGYVAGASRRAIAGVMVADALMIVVGAGATVSSGATRWALFAVSSVFHLTLFAYLYYVFPRTVPDVPSRVGLFSLLKNHIGLLWIAYPLVWVASPAGFGYATATGTALVFAFLDVLAKVPYLVFFYARRRAFEDEVVEETPDAPSVTPADD